MIGKMRSFAVQPQPDLIGSVASLLGSITALRDAIVAERHLDRKLWFRGHARASYELVPTIGRPHCYAGKEQTFSPDAEWVLLHRFRRRCYSFVDRPISPVEALFLARQHGLPTRLLDWTANALFALLFTCSEHVGEDGCLWAMLPHEETSDVDVFDLVNTETEVVLIEGAKQSGIKILFPFFNSPRIIAQEGVYTIHPDPWRPLDSYRDDPFEDGELDIERLYSWTIPSQAKIDILRQLSGLGITRRAVYPDLDGIARSLWETQVLWMP
jgi:hypothetical protein